MKIRTKLALLYTSITVGILVIVFVFVYLVTSRSIDNNYYTLLSEKALITAQKHFEEDELNQAAYEKILDIYKELLPETSETIILANDKAKAAADLQTFLTPQQIEQLFSDNPVRFKQNDKDAVAIYYTDNEGDFVVIVAAVNTQGEYIKTQLLRILIGILLISCLCIFILLWWNAGVITKPLQEMVNRMQKISAKDLHLRLDERKGNDELAQVINYFNQMIARLELSFDSQKTFIANASHEFKNPLTAIMGECEVMQLKDFTPEEYREAIIRIEHEVERLSKLMNSLLQLAQTDLDISKSDLEDLDIVEELSAVVAYFELSQYKGRVRFIPGDVCYRVKANKQMLFVAFQNLIDNACKYSDKEVRVELIKRKQQLDVIIADRGIGIPDDEKEHIFNTFYRAKNTLDYKGSGIGISLSLKILKLFGADMKIDSLINSGTSVVVSWNK